MESEDESSESLIDLQAVYTFERTLSQGVGGNHLFGWTFGENACLLCTLNALHKPYEETLLYQLKKLNTAVSETILLTCYDVFLKPDVAIR